MSSSNRKHARDENDTLNDDQRGDKISKSECSQHASSSSSGSTAASQGLRGPGHNEHAGMGVTFFCHAILSMLHTE
jgi:hypothetical protein